MISSSYRDLQGIFDADCLSVESADLKFYGTDWTRFYEPDPAAIVFPREINQVVELVQLANRNNLSLVPSGGRTGLSGGAVARHQEVVVSFSKMDKILEFDDADQLVWIEAGVITKQLQNFAEAHNCLYPVDFASSGSSQLGGNIATNAGGIKVLRYGLTRNWVAGLTVVTGKGDLLELNNGLIKNATGYDFRHLFVGSEGTLGMILGAAMKVTQAPVSLHVMLVSIPDMVSALKLLKLCQADLPVTAFEFFSAAALEQVMHHQDLAAPMTGYAPYYVLVEFEGGEGASSAMPVFEKALSQGWVLDGVMSQSESERLRLWQYREGISEAITSRTPYKHDISVLISQAPDFLRAIEAVVRQESAAFEVVWFGHIGDGNVHLNILRPEDWQIDEFRAVCEKLGSKIMAVVARFKGSISAEHGVGLLKKGYLEHSRSELDRLYMSKMKGLFDPGNIMNPGKLL
ncbi:MAG: FAD-binding oxidoreductase [Gammaproteobacteria bacterium]|nr:FAD-binding oxidoreductase [Gammaproteobacteria bacterium]MBT5204838.1 FAD-binding oxidoreductase [Gammaproteobacteria bacterium]MBT5601066.1 FAD-binding oxidoreductase [Gammaproteobacteria bacterium]MBT6246940.1 FAD-binding oxidoreductase [Gammaproteobacteria bacterium]